MRRIICGLPTLAHKGQDFLIEGTEREICVLCSSTTFVWNISHSEEKWTTYRRRAYVIACGTCYFAGFLRNLNFLDRFSKKRHMSNFMKIRPVGARTDRHNEDEICALLRYYAAYSVNSLPTFRDYLPAPYSRVDIPFIFLLGFTFLLEFLDYWIWCWYVVPKRR